MAKRDGRYQIWQGMPAIGLVAPTSPTPVRFTPAIKWLGPIGWRLHPDNDRPGGYFRQIVPNPSTHEPIKTVAPTPIIDRAHLLKLPSTTNSGPRVVSSLADDVPAGPNMPLPTAHEGRAREGAGFALRAGLSTREAQVRHWAHVGSNHVGRAPR